MESHSNLLAYLVHNSGGQTLQLYYVTLCQQIGKPFLGKQKLREISVGLEVSFKCPRRGEYSESAQIVPGH